MPQTAGGVEPGFGRDVERLAHGVQQSPECVDDVSVFGAVFGGSEECSALGPVPAGVGVSGSGSGEGGESEQIAGPPQQGLRCRADEDRGRIVPVQTRQGDGEEVGGRLLAREHGKER
nr:hypothetical protein [Streptomyces yunnanensis]